MNINQKTNIKMNKWCEMFLLVCRKILANDSIQLDDDLKSKLKNVNKIKTLLIKINEIYNVDLDFEKYLTNSTLRSLCREIEVNFSDSNSRAEKVFNKRKKIKKARKLDYYPLTYAQKRMWVLNKLEPFSPFYNLNRVEKIDGPLNTKALTDSFNILIARHESLRTNFQEKNGNPVQIIQPSQYIKMSHYDLTGARDKERKEKALVKQITTAPFKLETDQLLRCSLIKTDRDKHVLVLSMHHIISDGWSMGIFFRELYTAYNAFSQNQTPKFSKPTIQYKDYAVWEQSKDYQDKIKSQEKYWLDKLKGELPILNLPTDKPRPAIQTYNGSTERILIDEGLTRKLKSLARDQEVTMFTLLISVFNLFLFRITGQTDVIVGTPSANRKLNEISNVLGIFLNNLSLRTELNGQSVFSKIVEQVKENVIEATDNEDVPFEYLIDKLNPSRNLSQSPIFSVMFQYDSMPNKVLGMKGLITDFKFNDTNTTKFDLKIRATEISSNQLLLTCEYNTDLYRKSTIKKFLQSLEIIMASVATQPHIKTCELGLNLNYLKKLKVYPISGKSNSIEEKAYCKPLKQNEKQLSKIWQEILGVDKVSMNDNFFELGGHSLKAIRLVSRVNSELKEDIRLKTIFEYPVFSQLSKYLEKPKKRMIVSIKPVAQQSHYPLSHAQKRLWVLYQLEPKSPFYSINRTWELTGSVNAKALEKSINLLLERHESLRTNFQTVNGNPVQVVRPFKKINLKYKDLCVSNKELNVQGAINKETSKCFNLEKELLCRFKLLRKSKRKYFLVVSMHHIISDGWSMRVFFHELYKAYTAFSQNQTPELPKLTIQYRDYAVWEQSKEHQEKIKSQERYWLDKFEGELPILNLPTDKPRPAIQTYAGSTETIIVGENLTRGLKKLAKNSETTMFSLLLCAFEIFLFSITGQDDIIVGTPVAERENANTERIIGIFVNTIPIRLKIEPNLNFNNLFKIFKEGLMSDYANKSYPFEKLVEKLNIQRDLSRSPLYNVIFQADPNFSLDKPSSINPVTYQGNNTSIFDIRLSAKNFQNKNLALVCEYNNDIYNKSKINIFIHTFVCVINEIVRSPDKKISNYNIISQKDKKLVSKYNKTNKEASVPKNIYSMFEAQAKKTPHKSAINCYGEITTYQTIDKKADILAKALKKKFGRKKVIAITLERGPDVIIAMLAIIRSGNIFMPVSPETPKKRIKEYLNTSKAKGVVSREKYNYLFPGTVIDHANFINVDDHNFYQDGQAGISGNSIDANEFIYCIFTSGSTGKPKGVLYKHSSFVNLMEWQMKDFVFNKNQKVLSYSNTGFDVFLQEVFYTLLTGNELVMVNENDRLDSEKICDIVRVNKVNKAYFTPAILNLLIKDPARRKKLKGIKELVVSGDKLIISDHLKRFLTENPDLIIYNQYGPAETHVVTCYKFGGRYKNKAQSFVGRPILNTEAYIMDKYRRLLPIGIPGELYISGESLAHGYINDQVKTREVFLPHPFVKGKKIYKTGDKAVLHSDGNLEILGRVDRQIKIRGYRVEPEEVELVMKRVKVLNDVVVKPCIDKQEEVRLVAYYTSQSGEALEHLSLRKMMKKELPEYMIPDLFVHMDKIPLNYNGKFDTRSLSPPNESKPGNKRLLEPKTSIEKKLVTIWQNVLGVKSVGVNDNFFELGGNSLKMIELYSNLRRSVSDSITVQDMFDNQSIGEMAELFSHKGPETIKSREIEIIKI